MSKKERYEEIFWEEYEKVFSTSKSKRGGSIAGKDSEEISPDRSR